MSSDKPLPIDTDLRDRLTRLASRTNSSVEDFAVEVLRAHADEMERAAAEEREDEARWQRYLATGKTVSYETVRRKLQGLAAQAGRKAAPR
ncbi:MAG: hypothetical protein H6923_03165 [Alphaproteobacteria bacterium]|nr:hypothetical protein [Alphaproteobacteria bacterium]